MKSLNHEIPSEIQKIVGTKTYEIDEVGMSESCVRIYDEYVLKIQPHSQETDNEYAMSMWAGKKIRIPEIKVYSVVDGRAYNLMTKVEGKMLCDETYLKQPEKLIKLAAEGLKQLWKVDIKDCPNNTSRLSERLKAAEYNVRNGLVDIEDAEPETFGPNGFSSPLELLEWLKNNRPEEDVVLTHGDYCLPNIFIKDDEISGFIDLGKMGPADRWQDIALAIRSLRHNFDGTYTDGKKLFDFEPQMLMKELGMEFDSEKCKYYILLDELF